MGILAAPAFAQDIRWKGNDDYKGYMAAYNEKDLAKKAVAAEAFLAAFTVDKTDPLARQEMYMMLIETYYAGRNFVKAVETADKQATLAPNLPAANKKTVLLFGMDSAFQSRNTKKTDEYARKILAVDPKHTIALVTLSDLLEHGVPTNPADQAKHFEETLSITRRALAEPMPMGYTPAQWNAAKVHLNLTVAFVLLNQKQYPESIAASKAALAVDKKTGRAWYLIGLALLPGFNDANKKYVDAVKYYNDHRGDGQVVTDEAKANSDGALKSAETKKDEYLDALARAAVLPGENEKDARKALEAAFTGTPAELAQLLADKKAAVDAGN